MMSLTKFVRATPFIVIAHRGASGIAPENTLAALLRAIDDGAAMVEIDVQLSADNQVMVFHDDALERTTNGSGRLRHHTAQELRKLDAGSWFSRDFRGEQIPFLREALTVLRGKAYVNIELKPLEDSQGAEKEITSVVDLVKELDMAPYLAFSSFDHRVLTMVKTHSPKMHTIALNVPGDDRLPSDVVADCGAEAFGCALDELTAERAANAIECGIPFGVYTVNTIEELRHALKHRVHAVVSNIPQHINSLYATL